MAIPIRSNDDMARLKEIEDMGVDIGCLEFLQGYEFTKGNKVAVDKLKGVK